MIGGYDATQERINTNASNIALTTKAITDLRNQAER